MILPLDLLEFDPRHRPALTRAFGGSVIALDSATASELATRFSLSSVTPDGTVSSRGTVSGGHAGGHGGMTPSEQVMTQKLDLCIAEVGDPV